MKITKKITERPNFEKYLGILQIHILCVPDRLKQRSSGRCPMVASKEKAGEAGFL
jgi:hypothetical protein